MSSPDRISSTGVITPEAETFETNVSSGNATSRTYVGSKANMIAQRGVELLAGATATKLESTADGNYKLTVGYNFDASLGNAGADKPMNAHELENTLEYVDVWNGEVLNSKLLASFGSSAGVNGALAFLKGSVEQWDDSKKQPADVTKVEGLFSKTYAGAQLALMLNLFRGVAFHMIRSSPEFRTVYRRRITAASYTQVQAAFTGCGQIWTTDEIKAFESVPNDWWFTLPSDQTWLKAKPTVNNVAGQKTEIVYSYIGQALWWSGNFAAYASATLQTF